MRLSSSTATTAIGANPQLARLSFSVWIFRSDSPIDTLGDILKILGIDPQNNCSPSSEFDGHGGGWTQAPPSNRPTASTPYPQGPVTVPVLVPEDRAGGSIHEYFRSIAPAPSCDAIA
jgi:hypothetical protein